MKKILLAVLAGLIPALSVTNELKAQTPETSNYREPVKHRNKWKDIGVPDNSKTIGINPVNSKALKSFNKLYNVENAKWSEGKECITAIYTSNDVENYIYFDKKGHWTGAMKIYKENKMPADIRKIVKREYYDYKILLVQEVETVVNIHFPTYILTIEDEKNIKQIRIQNRDMDVYEEFKRGDG